MDLAKWERWERWILYAPLMSIFKKSTTIYYTVSSLSAKLVFSVLKDSILGSNSWQVQIEKIAFQTKSLGCCVSILLVFQNGPSIFNKLFLSFSMNFNLCHTHTPGKLAFWIPKWVVWVDVSPFPFRGSFSKGLRPPPSGRETRGAAFGRGDPTGRWSKKFSQKNVAKVFPFCGGFPLK